MKRKEGTVTVETTQNTIWRAGLSDTEFEAFLKQHFVGKQFTYDPKAPTAYATFTDGTVVYATNADRDEDYTMNMRGQQGTGTIARAWADEIEKWDDADTYTQLLYVSYEGDNTPHLIAQATFIHEPYEDWDELTLIFDDEY